MNRVLLLNSPIYWESTSESEQYLSPLGLGYIATCLEKAGIEVDLLDCVKEHISVSDILRYIDMSGASYIGMNVFTQNYDIVRYVMESIETKCSCLIGGQAVKFLYPEILRWSTNNDLFIIIGDGELIIPPIVLGKCTQEPEYRQDTKWVYRVNATSPYFPRDISSICLNRKYLGNEIVTNHYGEKEIAIVTSRGCVYDCAFCGGAKSLNQDIPTRIRTEESIVKELDEIVLAYPNVSSIRILDDLFLRGRQSILTANRIFSRYPQLSWRGMAHVLPLAGTFDQIKNLKMGRCRELFVGIESGSDRIRKKIKSWEIQTMCYAFPKKFCVVGLISKGILFMAFQVRRRMISKKRIILQPRSKKFQCRHLGTIGPAFFNLGLTTEHSFIRRFFKPPAFFIDVSIQMVLMRQEGLNSISILEIIVLNPMSFCTTIFKEHA